MFRMYNDNVHLNVKSTAEKLEVEQKVLRVLNNKVALKLRLDEVQLFKDLPLCHLLLSLRNTVSEQSNLPANEYDLDYYSQVLIDKIKDAVKHGKALRFTHLETALLPLTSIGQTLDIQDCTNISTVSDYISSIASKLDNAITINQGFRLSKLEVELLVNTPKVSEYVHIANAKAEAQEEQESSVTVVKSIEDAHEPTDTAPIESESNKPVEVASVDIEPLQSIRAVVNANTSIKNEYINNTISDSKHTVKETHDVAENTEPTSAKQEAPVLQEQERSLNTMRSESLNVAKYNKLADTSSSPVSKPETTKSEPRKEIITWCIAQEADCDICEWEFLIDRKKAERGHWTKNNPKIIKRYSSREKAEKMLARYAKGRSTIMLHKDAVQTIKEQVSDLRFERAFK